MKTSISDLGLASQLRDRFGIRGAIDTSIDTEVQLVADVSELRAPFHSTIGGVFSLQSGPVAAQLAYVGLRAPTTLPSNFRARVSHIGMASGTAGQLCSVKIANSAALDAAIGAPAVNIINGSWDSPQPDQPPIRQGLQSFKATSVTAFGQDGFAVQLGVAQATSLLARDWVIAPGNTLFIQGSIVNATLFGSFYWDEFYVG